MLECEEADSFPMTFKKIVTESELEKKNSLDGYLEWDK